MSRRFLSMYTRSCVAGIFLLAVSFFAAAADAGSWQGNEVTKDGIIHVQNPATPAEKPSTLTPSERWRVGGDDESDEVIFGVLRTVATDDAGNVYLLDSQLNEVQVYSPQGEYLRTIGREGEGPGEFRRPGGMFITGDGRIAVMQMMPGRIILLTPDGEGAGNHPIPEQDGMMMFTGGSRAGDSVVLATQAMGPSGGGGFTVTSALIRIDSQGKETAKYWEKTDSRNMNNLVFDEREMGGGPIWGAGPDGRVFTCDEFDGYKVRVWNPDGTADRVIEREFKLRKRSDEEKDWRGPRIAVRTGEGDLKTEVIKSETDRTVQAIYPQSNGDVWVLSSRGAFDAGEDEIGTFDVFDKTGKFTQQITLKGEGNLDHDGFYFSGDNLFVLLGQVSARRSEVGGPAAGDDEPKEAEPMSVICYDIGTIVQSKR